MSSQGKLIVEDLGKRYRLDRAPVERADTGGGWRGALRRARDWFGSTEDPALRDFWALRSASFEVEPGTILGVIGPNGAGKSTLLKILARVTPPTEGRVRGSGRVVSLLELGAGFNADLTARENVIMNAAMHGMPKAEVMERMGDILAFAEIDQFLDQPVKYFSSGMNLRLAFSVAIHMNPQILLADEILAVGDLVFQERCLERVAQAGREGLIVLFVSHDMDAIVRVCNKVIWLNKGTVASLGEPEEVVAEYQASVWDNSEATRYERGRQESRFCSIRGVKLLSAAGKEIGAAPTTEDVFVRIDLEAFKRVSVRGGLDLLAKNQLVFRAQATEWLEILEPGMYSLMARIPAHLLADINYTVNVSVTTLREGQAREYTLVVYSALSFMAYNTATEGAVTSKGKLNRTGFVSPRLEWTVEAAHVPA